MGLGLCIVGLGLLVGLFYQSLKAELAYLLVGLAVFLIGTFLQRRSA